MAERNRTMIINNRNEKQVNSMVRALATPGGEHNKDIINKGTHETSGIPYPKYLKLMEHVSMRADKVYKATKKNFTPQEQTNIEEKRKEFNAWAANLTVMYKAPCFHENTQIIIRKYHNGENFMRAYSFNQ